mgnify:CR=1 FL=1
MREVNVRIILNENHIVVTDEMNGYTEYSYIDDTHEYQVYRERVYRTTQTIAGRNYTRMFIIQDVDGVEEYENGTPDVVLGDSNKYRVYYVN